MIVNDQHRDLIEIFLEQSSVLFNVHFFNRQLKFISQSVQHLERIFAEMAARLAVNDDAMDYWLILLHSWSR